MSRNVVFVSYLYERIFRVAKKVKQINCRACDGTMKMKTLSSGNCLGLCIALALFGVGLVLCFFPVPIFGAIVGVPLMIAALFVGGKKSKVWQCTTCGTTINRS